MVSSSTSKPDWLPDELWPWLQRYRDPYRRADPTEGFARRIASHHPLFDENKWASRSATARWTYVRGILDIPDRVHSSVEVEDENVR
jgi:hypothetical protein